MDIIPRRTLSILRNSIKFSTRCYTIPFEEKDSSASQKVEWRAFQSPWKQRFWRLNLIYQTLTSLFCTYRFLWGILILGMKNLSIVDVGLVAFQSIGFGYACYLMVLLHRDPRDYVVFLNFLSSYSPKLIECQNSAEGDTFHILSACLIHAAYLQSCCNGFLFLTRKDGFQYLWGLLQPRYKTPVVFILSLVQEVLAPMNSWNAVLSMFLGYAMYTHYVGRHLAQWGHYQKLHRAKDRKSIQATLIHYREIQIATQLYHRCYGVGIIPSAMMNLLFLVSWMSFITLNLFKADSSSNNPLVAFVLFPAGTLALFVIAFSINSEGKGLFEESNGLINEWKRSLYMKRKRIVQSLYPLKSQVGPLYHLKRRSPLIFSSNALALTVNFILTF